MNKMQKKKSFWQFLLNLYQRNMIQLWLPQDMFLHNYLSFTRRNIHSATHKSPVFRYYRFIIIMYQWLLIVISLHIIMILSLLNSAAPFGFMEHHSFSSTFNSLTDNVTIKVHSHYLSSELQKTKWNILLLKSQMWSSVVGREQIQS